MAKPKSKILNFIAPINPTRGELGREPASCEYEVDLESGTVQFWDDVCDNLSPLTDENVVAEVLAWAKRVKSGEVSSYELDGATR